jgi:hypothetical protein
LYLQENQDIGELEEKIARENYEAINKLEMQENEELLDIKYLPLENLIKASNVYTGKNKIVLLKVPTEQLETAIKSPRSDVMKKIFQSINYSVNPENVHTQASKLLILSDGEKMLIGTCDANMVYRSDYNKPFSIDEESVFKNIIKKENSDMFKLSLKYAPNAIISALKENYALALSGSPNIDFEELIKKNL